MKSDPLSRPPKITTTGPRVGDQVAFVVGYSDATVFLHDHLYGVRDGQLEVIWPILGRGQTR